MTKGGATLQENGGSKACGAGEERDRWEVWLEGLRLEEIKRKQEKG